MCVCVCVSLQVCARCYQLLLNHMTRFTYSPTGALKWKKDVNEYAEVGVERVVLPRMLSDTRLALLLQHSCTRLVLDH